MRAMVMACCISASVAVGFDLVARDASCLVCHRRFGGEDNPWDMVTYPWVSERALWNSPSNCKPNVRLRCLRCVSLPLSSSGVLGGASRVRHLLHTAMVTKWFYSTRLETRTKESNICASSWVSKPTCAMKVSTEIFASAADRSIGRGLSMSISVRTRKMVNYACEG